RATTRSRRRGTAGRTWSRSDSSADLHSLWKNLGMGYRDVIRSAELGREGEAPDHEAEADEQVGRLGLAAGEQLEVVPDDDQDADAEAGEHRRRHPERRLL